MAGWLVSYNCVQVNLTRVVLPHLLSRAGTVATVSSTAGKAGVPFSCSYTGSKHALHGYMESLRTEKAGTGLGVCMLCPGPTFSDLLQASLCGDSRDGC